MFDMWSHNIKAIKEGNNTISVCSMLSNNKRMYSVSVWKPHNQRKLAELITIAIWACLCECVTATTQKHVYTGCVCVFMWALSDYSLWSGAQRPTVAHPGTVILSPPSNHPSPPSSSLQKLLLQGGQHISIKVQALWSSALFIVWSAMIDALLIQI